MVLIRQFKNPLPSSLITLVPDHHFYLRQINGFPLDGGNYLMGIVTHLIRLFSRFQSWTPRRHCRVGSRLFLIGFYKVKLVDVSYLLQEF
jgi:hypothetical protein